MQGRQSAKATLLLFAVTALLWSTSRASGDSLREQEATSASLATLETLSPEMRGDLLMIRRQYLSAINAYQSAPRDSAVVSNKLGIAYHHVYALDQAKMEYQKALLLRPNYSQAINNLGAVYYAEKDYKRAERLYRHSLKLNPRSATAYSNLGTAYFTEGKTKQGIAAYRNAFALDPLVFAVDPSQMISETTSPEERARLDFCLAEIYAQAGMDERALALLRKAVDEGFKDSKRLMQAPEFAQLRKTAEFAQLMALEKQP